MNGDELLELLERVVDELDAEDAMRFHDFSVADASRCPGCRARVYVREAVAVLRNGVA